MRTRLFILTLTLPVFAQLVGCHYYIKAIPDIIFSSEPFTPPTNHNIHNNLLQPAPNE